MPVKMIKYLVDTAIPNLLNQAKTYEEIRVARNVQGVTTMSNDHE